LGRRPRQTAPVTSFRIDDLEMDLLARLVRRGGQLIDLQPREFRLLEYLMQHAEQVVTRAMLLEKVWDLDFDPHTNVVETHVSRLRAKVDKGHSTPLIHTIRGSGYCLRASS
jgi:two-component system OmpR family response regulator